MAASTNDYLKKTGAGTVTSLAAPGKALSATSITVGSTTNYPSDTGIVIAIRQVDSNGDLIAGTYTEWSATVTSPTTLSIVATPVYGSDQIYAAGSTTQVYIPVSSYAHNKLIDGLLAAGMNQTGSFENIVADTVTANEFITAGANANGWTVGLPTPDTVTYNGNRSYDLVFNSNDLTDTLSNGMRTRFTRTVTPPTQCTDLESGSSQYWVKTSPAGLSFTTTYSVSAWVKLESYGSMGVVARKGSVSAAGWACEITSDGTVLLRAGNTAANLDQVQSYQSIPLGKWVHIAGSLTVGTAAGAIYIDGISVPVVTTNGTSTTITQSGNLTIGSSNAPDYYFDGKIAQVAVYSAIISQANIQAAISQGMTGSETSCVGLWKFNGDGNDSNANANNLTATNGPTATTVDSPFNATEYGIITANSFSTNTTLTVQVPEGYAIPTSGGVSAVAYSTQDVPYGFPRDKGKWQISCLGKVAASTTSTSFTTSNYQITAPVGVWRLGYQTTLAATRAATTFAEGNVTLSASSSAEDDSNMSAVIHVTQVGSSTTTVKAAVSKEKHVALTATTPYYLDYKIQGAGITTSLNDSSTATSIYAYLNYV